MFHDLLDRVRAEASGERARASVASISRFHRVQSSPGYDQAAAWLEEALREDGLKPTREEVPGDGHTRYLGLLMPRGWECRSAVATLVDGRERRTLCDYALEPLSLVLRSTAAEGTYPIRDIGDGSEPGDYEGRDVRGAVVLASGPVHHVHRLAVVERGAAGILTDTRRLVPPVRTADDERDAVNYTSFWWGEDEPRGWGFVVTVEEGARLRARLAAGAALTLEAAIDARDFAHRIPLISTRVGPAGGAEVMVTAHLCHPFACANDNGSGVAATLEIARVLAKLEREGHWRPAHRAVRFLWMPELTGTHAWLGSDPARASRLVAAINLDMVGQRQSECGSTFLLEHPPCFAGSFAEELLGRIRGQALDWVESYSGPGHYSMVRMGEVPYSGGSDHTVYLDPAIGVPCPMLIQWPDRFYHSSHDTIEHTDPDSLALAVRCGATYAGFLAAAGPAEAAWMLGAVERGARRRVLERLDERDAQATLAREARRGAAAIRSCARLGVSEDEIAETLAGWTRFLDTEAGGARGAAGGPRPVTRRPQRRVAAPLDFQIHLWPGFEALTAAERDELRTLRAEFPGGSVALEVAWYACDGRRDLFEIAELVRLESGVEFEVAGAEPGRLSLERYFTLTERLGLSSWESVPAAAARTPA